jgi:hypothetical protein
VWDQKLDAQILCMSGVALSVNIYIYICFLSNTPFFLASSSPALVPKQLIKLFSMMLNCLMFLKFLGELWFSLPHYVGRFNTLNSNNIYNFSWESSTYTKKLLMNYFYYLSSPWLNFKFWQKCGIIFLIINYQGIC